MISLRAEKRQVRGGDAPTWNWQKMGVVTAHWIRHDVSQGLTPKAAAAFEWLMRYNATYAKYVEQHRRLTSAERGQDWLVIKTAELLLNMPGVEVAARPWLYPHCRVWRLGHQGALKETGPADAQEQAVHSDQLVPEAPEPPRRVRGGFRAVLPPLRH